MSISRVEVFFFNMSLDYVLMERISIIKKEFDEESNKLSNKKDRLKIKLHNERKDLNISLREYLITEYIHVTTTPVFVVPHPQHALTLMDLQPNRSPQPSLHRSM